MMWYQVRKWSYLQLFVGTVFGEHRFPLFKGFGLNPPGRHFQRFAWLHRNSSNWGVFMKSEEILMRSILVLGASLWDSLMAVSYSSSECWRWWLVSWGGPKGFVMLLMWTRKCELVLIWRLCKTWLGALYHQQRTFGFPCNWSTR